MHGASSEGFLDPAGKRSLPSLAPARQGEGPRWGPLGPPPPPSVLVLRGKGRKALTCEMLWARDCQHHEGDRTGGGQRGLCHIPVLALWLCDLREMAEPLCAVVRPCSKQ